MRVKLLKIRRLDIAGRSYNGQPGEWVDVGRSTALKWIEKGIAIGEDTLVIEDGCGVVLPDLGNLDLKPLFETLPVSIQDPPRLVFHRSILWNGDRTKLPNLRKLLEGLSILNTWQVAAPMENYDILAQDIGTGAERDRLKAQLHDLRVPLYDPSLMFVRQCPESIQLMDAYARYQAEYSDLRHAFLAAYYEVKPLLEPLPHQWVNGAVV